MAVIMIGASSSKDPRSFIQNGFWAIKYMIVIGITIGAFFIPAGSFGTAWMWVGLMGGLVFILVQLVLLVDFAHNWSDSWLGKESATIFSFYLKYFHFRQLSRKRIAWLVLCPFDRNWSSVHFVDCWRRLAIRLFHNGLFTALHCMSL